METCKSGMLCFFVSIPTIKYLMIKYNAYICTSIHLYRLQDDF